MNSDQLAVEGLDFSVSQGFVDPTEQDSMVAGWELEGFLASIDCYVLTGEWTPGQYDEAVRGYLHRNFEVVIRESIGGL